MTGLVTGFEGPVPKNSSTDFKYNFQIFSRKFRSPIEPSKCRYGHVNFFVSTSMASHCHVTSLMTWSGLEPNLDFEIARLDISF
ncbi:unnamed protein product [Rhizophagus irregularis]|uniref:Uncharacterized protein n=1 Tax=Rhizophagus irregularis TaxID=588596 RepID=A0A915YWX4_9GLOM|nr:unnamed protein product [Rhizophagus irregularis]